MNRSRTSSRRTGPWLAAAALVILAWLLLSPRSTTIFDADSPFGRVRVMERADGLRTLVTGAGRARQSAIFPGRPMHLELAYTRVGAIGLALAPPDARILFVGLGGGAMPMFARHVLPDARIDVVEIDPLIVDVAQRYFGFTPDDRMRVHTADGRAFIEQAPAGSWDLIVLDAFSDDEVPFALTTRQFLEAVRSRLAPDGIVISNLWSRSPAYPAMLATYLDVFPHVDLLRVPRRNQLILVAAPPDRPLGRERLLRAASALAGRVDLGFDLTRLTSGAYRPARRPDAPVLDDSLAADLHHRSPEDPHGTPARFARLRPQRRHSPTAHLRRRR